MELSSMCTVADEHMEITVPPLEAQLLWHGTEIELRVRNNEQSRPLQEMEWLHTGANIREPR